MGDNVSMRRKDLDAVKVLFSITKTLVCYQHCFREKSIRLLTLFTKRVEISLKKKKRTESSEALGKNKR